MRKGRELVLFSDARRLLSTATPTLRLIVSPFSSSPPRRQMDSSVCSPSPDSPERYSYNPTLRWNPEVGEYFIQAYGAEGFARISESLTRPSCYSCIRVNTLKSSTDAVVKKLVEILDNKRLVDSTSVMNVREEKVASEFDLAMKEGDIGESYNLATRGAGNGDTLMAGSHSFSISKCPYPGLDDVLFVKGTGPHLVKYDGQNGKPVREVIVSRRCAEAVLRGAQVFVPGVLACSAHVEKGDEVAVSVAVEQPASDGGWVVGITRGIVLQGSDSDPRYYKRSGFYIGLGTTMMSRAGIFRASKGIAVEMTERVYRLPSLHDVLEGEIFLQNLPSIITARVLDPKPGEHVLDMCAAPGGKTTAIGILMRDEGEIVAIDRSHNKVMDILKLATEMDLTCIKAFKLDALKSVFRVNGTTHVDVPNFDSQLLGTLVENSRPSGFANDLSISLESCNAEPNFTGTDDEKANRKRYASKAEARKIARRMKNGPGRNDCLGGRVEKSKGFPPNSFDRVLLDAPCSALGLRPRLFVGEETLESLGKHAKYQRNMFRQAIQLVRSGGVIVYSTCTINPGENEALVRYALDTYKFLSLAPQHPRIGGRGLVGRCDLFDGKFVEEWLNQSEAELVQRFDPSSSLDTIGFFIAKFNVGQKDM